MAVNSVSGIVMFLHRKSPEVSAKELWKVDSPPPEQLPLLRSSSDIAWALWNRVAGPNVRNIKYFMALTVVNVQTKTIVVPRALKAMGVADGVPKNWPGTGFKVNSDNDDERKAADALIGE
jgi:hypothetical protein